MMRQRGASRVACLDNLPGYWWRHLATPVRVGYDDPKTTTHCHSIPNASWLPMECCNLYNFRLLFLSIRDFCDARTRRFGQTAEIFLLKMASWNADGLVSYINENA